MQEKFQKKLAAHIGKKNRCCGCGKELPIRLENWIIAPFCEECRNCHNNEYDYRVITEEVMGWLGNFVPVKQNIVFRMRWNSIDIWHQPVRAAGGMTRPRYLSCCSMIRRDFLAVHILYACLQLWMAGQNGRYHKRVSRMPFIRLKQIEYTDTILYWYMLAYLYERRKDEQAERLWDWIHEDETRDREMGLLLQDFPLKKGRRETWMFGWLKRHPLWETVGGYLENPLFKRCRLNTKAKLPVFGIVCYEAKCEAAEATGETDETERMIRDAISAGYRFFLTDVKTEEILGEVVDSCCIPREDFFISAKCESDSLNDEEMAKGLECARANLKMEYVDLFTVKWPKIDSTSSEKRTWKQMAKELDSGRVRAISCLELSEQQLKSFIQIEGIRPTAIQLDFSSLTWKIIRYCKENQICVLARGPEKEDLDGLIDNLQLNELTQKYQKEIIQIFWRFLLQQGMILLVNLSDLNAMQDQPGISDFILTDEEIGVISNVIK